MAALQGALDKAKPVWQPLSAYMQVDLYSAIVEMFWLQSQGFAVWALLEHLSSMCLCICKRSNHIILSGVV